MTLSFRHTVYRLRHLVENVDWFLLLFLVGFCIDSIVIKPLVMGLALIWLGRSFLRPGYRDAPWFYLALPAMELVRFLAFNSDLSAGRIATLVIGSAYWVMAWIAFLILRHRTRLGGMVRTAATMELWFLLNFACSLLQLEKTMVAAGSLNPYGLADLRFGNSTGDYIRGLFLAPCYLNMFVNSFFAVWFLYRKRWTYALLAAAVCCLTSTNFANIVFLPVLAMLLFVLRTRQARLCIAGCFGIFIAFYGLAASGNLAYLRQSVQNTSGAELTQKPAGLQPETDSAIREREHAAAIYLRLARPNGKMLSWKQTAEYSRSGVPQLLFGAGMGNFSSLLALQMAHIYGRKHSRFYEHMPAYVHPEYQSRHFQIMRDVYDLPEGYHSARHMPHSFPNQLIGEYGLLGLAFFLFGYLGYFLRRGGYRGYFLIMMVLTAGYLWFDYLFEYLSVIVFFDLFFLQSTLQKQNPEAHA